MPRSLDRHQQLHATNISVNIGEALEARVKDPLWFLARQWQTGEFEAENGGRPTQMSITSREFPFTSVSLGNNQQPIDRAAPLEAIIEAETPDGDAPAWRSAALEYEFGLKATGHAFRAVKYPGRSLNWHHFDYEGTAPGIAPAAETLRITPTQLYFAGAPHPRWWRLEEGHAYFDSPADPEPNVLSLLLPEFFYADINNWYTAPLRVKAGSLCEVTKVSVFDSFGVKTDLDPVTKADSDAEWALFAPDSTAAAGGKSLDGRYLFVPNIAMDILQNDEVEEVRFIRDEDANLVWAWERRIVGDDGVSLATRPERVGGPGEPVEDSLPRFVLKSATSRNWIPYVPRQVAALGALDGEIHLRRARTNESATEANPQYRSRIVGESRTINEEEVPVTGLRIRRVARFARGSDGTPYIWTGREKETAQRTARPGLRFDYLMKRTV